MASICGLPRSSFSEGAATISPAGICSSTVRNKARSPSNSRFTNCNSSRWISSSSAWAAGSSACTWDSSAWSRNSSLAAASSSHRDWESFPGSLIGLPAWAVGRGGGACRGGGVPGGGGAPSPYPKDAQAAAKILPGCDVLVSSSSAPGPLLVSFVLSVNETAPWSDSILREWGIKRQPIGSNLPKSANMESILLGW